MYDANRAAKIFLLSQVTSTGSYERNLSKFDFLTQLPHNETQQTSMKCKNIDEMHFNLPVLDKTEEISHNDANIEWSPEEDFDCRSLTFERFELLRTVLFLQLF